MRRALQLETLRERLTPQSEPIELILQSPAWRGRITVLHLDDSEEGALHHFVVALEPFSDGSASEKQQLSRYYDQLRQSILENGGGYVDALLDSARASRAPHLAPCAWLGAYRSTLGHAAGQPGAPGPRSLTFSVNGGRARLPAMA